MIRKALKHEEVNILDFISEEQFDYLNQYFGDIEIIHAILAEKEGEHYVFFDDNEQLIAVELSPKDIGITVDEYQDHKQIRQYLKDGTPITE